MTKWRDIRYEPYADADKRRASARQLVKLLLDAKGLLPSHQRRFLSHALWAVTEADAHKYKVRYRSLKSFQKRAALRHDHVYERAKMINDLLLRPDDMDAILENAIACVVTRNEHDELTRISRARPDLDGWDRYRASDIVVIDTLTGENLTDGWRSAGTESSTPRK